MSGATPSCWQANIRPVLPRPVGISSNTSSVPWRSQAARTRAQKPAGATCGTARIGSATRQATSPSRSRTYSIMRAQAAPDSSRLDVP